MCSPSLPIASTVHWNSPAETHIKTCVTFHDPCHMNCNNYALTSDIKIFNPKNKPGSESVRTVPRWVRAGSTQTDWALGYGTPPAFHQDLCSRGTNPSDCLCTGWEKQKWKISCLNYHNALKILSLVRYGGLVNYAVTTEICVLFDDTINCQDYTVSMMDEWVWGIGGTIMTGWNQSGEKPVPLP